MLHQTSNVDVRKKESSNGYSLEDYVTDTVLQRSRVRQDSTS